MSDQDDDLRLRLRAQDPAAGPLDPFSDPRVHELLERTMSTPLLDAPRPAEAMGRRRRWPLAAATGVAVLGVGGALVLADDGAAPRRAPSSVVLAVAPADAMASCLPVSAEFLKDMPVALAGTATAVSPQEVRLEVDRWYAGGSADVAVLRPTTTEDQALVGGTSFTVGDRYLVSASEGTVSACGYSGPATPDLQQVYDEAFPG